MHYQTYSYRFYVDVILDRCYVSCNTIDDTFGRIYPPNRTKDVNLSVFNRITRINESKTLTKHISCKYKCEFDDRKCNSNQKWDNNKYRSECKTMRKHQVSEKIIFGILVHVLIKMVNTQKVLLVIQQLRVIELQVPDKNCYNKNYFNKISSNKFLYFTHLFIM